MEWDYDGVLRLVRMANVLGIVRTATKLEGLDGNESVLVFTVGHETRVFLQRTSVISACVTSGGEKEMSPGLEISQRHV